MTLLRPYSPVLHYDDINGRPLVGGKLYVYEANTSTPAVTYRNPSGTDLNENPVTLDERGNCKMWIDTSKRYKFVLWDSTETEIVMSEDDVTAPGGGAGPSPEPCNAVFVEYGSDSYGTIVEAYRSDKIVYTRRLLDGRPAVLSRVVDAQNPHFVFDGVGNTMFDSFYIKAFANGTWEVESEVPLQKVILSTKVLISTTFHITSEDISNGYVDITSKFFNDGNKFVNALNNVFFISLEKTPLLGVGIDKVDILSHVISGTGSLFWSFTEFHYDDMGNYVGDYDNCIWNRTVSKFNKYERIDGFTARLYLASGSVWNVDDEINVGFCVNALQFTSLL